MKGNRIQVMSFKEREMEAEESSSVPGASKMADNRQRVSKLWGEFCRDTSFHGFKNIEDKQKHRMERVMWALVVMGMMSGMLYFLAQSYISYYKYNVMTTTQIMQSASLPFPAITICNLGIYDTTQGKPLTKTLTKFMYMLSARKSNVKFNFNDPEVIAVMNSPFNEFYETHSFNVSEMFLALKYDGILLTDISKYMKPVDTEMGRCYMFNGPASKGVDSRKISTKTGYEYGFIAYLNIKQDAYPFIADTSAGLRVTVHEPHEFPRPRLDGVLMAPGTANFIKLQRTGYTFLPHPYRSYGNGYCTETSALPYQNYSYDRCVFQWIIKKVYYDCNCSTLPIEGLPFKKCSFLDIGTCILRKSIKYYTQVAQMNVSSDDCPRPCEVVLYKPQMTSSAYPSQPALKLYANGSKSNEQYIRDNYLTVYVFYDRFLEERVEYVPEYTSMSILGNLGGQMGFFLGASLVTITEVVQTALLTIWMFFCRFIKRF